MRRLPFLILPAVLVMVFSFSGLAQTGPDSSRVFTLGQVTITPQRKDTLDRIGYRETQQFQRLTVATALNLMPGVAQSNVGPRNESMIYVRGFDLRRTPLFIDGIPVYVPYDGYVDLARFTTFNLSQITVEKGGASVLYGPNTMGGVINLVTAKPEGKLDVYGGGGWLTGGHEEFVNVGSRLNHFYIQADASRYERDYFNLSHSFTPTRTQGSGDRGNSYNDDWRYGVKLGFTPNANNEYAIGFNHQDGTKGTPVYAGSDTLNSLFKSPRYWKWPKWNKQDLYFLSNTKWGKDYFKSRLYYDQFINTLQSFDNATYTTQTRPYAFTSYYNDYTLGANVEYGHSFSTANILKMAVHFKNDVHRENNAGQPVRKMSDDTYSIGITDEHTFDTHWYLQGGASFNTRQSLEAQNYNSKTGAITNFPSNDNNAVDVQAKLIYTLQPRQTFEFNVSRMTRFATIKDRYSYSLGTALPNPGLHAEDAVNLGLNYTDVSIRKLKLQGSIFYSLIDHVIQSVNNVAIDTTTDQELSQEQNTGRAAFYGAEAAVTYDILQDLKAGVNYSFIKRRNLDNPSLLFTDVPEHKVFAWAQYTVSPLTLLLSGEYDASRFSTSYGAQAPSFFLANASAFVRIDRWFTLQGGVNNVFDRNYMLTEGYPEQGRNYFAKLIVHYQHR
ncbi:MAG: TonB-dependent receptor [Puia sp.]|nr:TonB-dependent receptor [Puia sp.]